MTNNEPRPLADEVPELIDEIKHLKESYNAERAAAAKQRQDDRRRRVANRILGALLGVMVLGIFAILVQEQQEVQRDKDDRDAARQLIRDNQTILETILAYSDPNSEISQRGNEQQAVVISGLVKAIREGVREDLAAVVRCQETTFTESALTACLLEELPLSPTASPTPTPEPGTDD